MAQNGLKKLDYELPEKYYILHMRYGDFKSSKAHVCLSENFYLII